MVELRRKIYERLLYWKNTSSGSTAVLLEGARRVRVLLPESLERGSMSPVY